MKEKNMSKNYWDLPVKQRANLTEDQVREFIPWALMEAGVPKATEAKLREVEDIQIRKKTYYAVVGSKNSFSKETVAIFENIDDASSFISLSPMKRDYCYSMGSDYEYCELFESLSIEEIQLSSRHEVENLRPRLESRKEAKEHNERESSRYQKECDAIKKATSGIWEDWYQQSNRLAEAQNIQATLNEYLELCDGDHNLAKTFLLKAVSSDDIENANEFLDSPILIGEVSCEQ